MQKVEYEQKGVKILVSISVLYTFVVHRSRNIIGTLARVLNLIKLMMQLEPVTLGVRVDRLWTRTQIHLLLSPSFKGWVVVFGDSFCRRV